MVGIDVVDVVDPLFKKRDSRALALILNTNDQHQGQDDLFWLLWTAKEAIFKSRRELKSFAPKTIPVTIEESHGDLLFYSGNLSGHFIISADYIGAVCVSSSFSVEYLFCEMETGDASFEVREKLLRSCGKDSTIVNDSQGLPTLSGNQPISFTHHRRFGGYAYPKI